MAKRACVLRALSERNASKMEAEVPASEKSDASGSGSESEDEFDPESSADSDSSEQLFSEDEKAFNGAIGSRKRPKKYVCEECGVAFAKPALLTQHMSSHSDQRHFACSVSGCSCSYKRQDHLHRHMKKHEGIVFSCSRPGCHQSFSVQSNLRRHLKYHEEKAVFPRPKATGEKALACSKPGCGKLFRYQSERRTHEEGVHGELKYAELYCVYPGCGDKFTSEKALIKHAESSHPYLLCEVCGETISRKSFKRHLWMHATRVPLEVVCPYDDCGNTYTRESNLRQHVRSVHLMLKPFVCSHEGCGKRYAHKASRDRHDLSGLHQLPTIDFEDQDQLRLPTKGRGGRKRVWKR